MIKYIFYLIYKILMEFKSNISWNSCFICQQNVQKESAQLTALSHVDLLFSSTNFHPSNPEF